MEVRIRLQRAGGNPSQKTYNYRIVAISRASSRQSKFLDLIGFYDPAKKPAVINVNHDKLDKWVSKGAQMSDTVKSLVKKSKNS